MPPRRRLCACDRNTDKLMPLEIERKFLLADDGWKNQVTRRIHIRDGLIASDNGNKARVRISDSGATITLKSRRCGPIRSEFEYSIPFSDAVEMLRSMCDGRVLEKVRHVIAHAGAVWYVDVYEGTLNGVVLAEIELQQPNKKIDLPSWIGKEVTADPSYRKINMLINAWSTCARAGPADSHTFGAVSRPHELEGEFA